MSSGEITVTGKGDVQIPLLGRPRHVEVHFVNDPAWIPCNHHHHHKHDKLNYFVDSVDEDPRHHHDPVHQHRDREYVLVIEWQVEGIREIHWHVTY